MCLAGEVIVRCHESWQLLLTSPVMSQSGAAVRTLALSYGSTSTALMNGPSDATTVSTAVNQPRTNHRRPLWSRDQLCANQGLAMARRSVNQGGDVAGDISWRDLCCH